MSTPTTAARPGSTMAEVARRAGVSVSTVSHVLNGTRAVRPSTRLAVEQAVHELAYTPNSLARALRTSRSMTIGLVMPAISNPYLGGLLQSLQSETERCGYSLIVADTHDDPAHELRAVRGLVHLQVDGIVLAPSARADEALSLLELRKVPTTLLDRLPAAPLDGVGTENVTSTAELTAHLAGHGYRRIGMVTGLRGLVTTEERLAGYQAGLRSAGLEPHAAIVTSGSSHATGARLAVHALLDTDEPPDALVVGNNHMMIGVLQALTDRGRSVPGDVALGGFDDFPWADLFSPRLTMVAQPDAELGRTAVTMLLDRIKDYGRPTRTVRLAPKLHLRESCGCSPRDMRCSQ